MHFNTQKKKKVKKREREFKSCMNVVSYVRERERTDEELYLAGSEWWPYGCCIRTALVTGSAAISLYDKTYLQVELEHIIVCLVYSSLP